MKTRPSTLGDVTLQPGHRLSGRVVLTDGKPVPDGMRILLSAERAWDDQTHDLPPDGRFEFVGLPTDDFSIPPAVKGYHLSGKNPNLNLGVEGFIDRDVDNFVILLDPGKDDSIAWERLQRQAPAKRRSRELCRFVVVRLSLFVRSRLPARFRNHRNFTTTVIDRRTTTGLGPISL